MTSDSSAQPAFSTFALPDTLLQATDDLGFAHCTEIQALTLPLILAGTDVAAQAQTGTGKTAAFLLGSFSRLLANDGGERARNQPRMLVIAPTRELAMQIKKDADELSRHTSLTTAVVYGGIDYEKQRSTVAAGADVLIGTPGRLIDYFKQRVFDLKKCEVAVLDEADRMFDLGFIADIRFLLRRMPDPENRQSMLFSATLSHRVMELAYEHMNNPQAVKTVSTGVTAERVRQHLFQPATEEKIPLLLGLFRDRQPERSIVFVNTKRVAERVENYLVGNGVACGTLSGDVRQKRREKILADFTAGKLPVLIATDVAARGLHIDDVTHVFNYDLPQQAEDYVHRIGRTARAGSAGEALSFACEEYSFSLPEIEEYIGRRIPLSPITDELLVTPEKPARIERDRVEPRRKGGDRGGRGGPGDKRRSDGKGGPRRSPKRSTADKASAKSPADHTEAKPVTASSSAAPSGDAGTATADAPAKRKRRRRRRARKPSAEVGHGQTAQDGNNAASSDSDGSSSN